MIFHPKQKNKSASEFWQSSEFKFLSFTKLSGQATKAGWDGPRLLSLFV